MPWGEGDCFEVAANEVLKRGGEWRLVHATVLGQGKVEGVRFGHAWIETDDLVFDGSNGREVTLPREFYYALGRVQDAHRYDVDEARENLLTNEHYGPWE